MTLTLTSGFHSPQYMSPSQRRVRKYQLRPAQRDVASSIPDPHRWFTWTPQDATSFTAQVTGLDPAGQRSLQYLNSAKDCLDPEDWADVAWEYLPEPPSAEAQAQAALGRSNAPAGRWCDSFRAQEVTLHRCSRCNVWYCGEACQKRAWQAHKSYCSDYAKYCCSDDAVDAANSEFESEGVHCSAGDSGGEGEGQRRGRVLGGRDWG